MEQEKVKSKDIYDSLIKMFDNHRYVCLNTYVFNGYESDFLSITADKNQYIYEIEVKVSVADFKKDFESKGRKHKLMDNSSANFITIGGSESDFPNSEKDLKGKDFLRIQQGSCCPVSFMTPKDCLPNRFYFATPKGLLRPDMIPRYAGLIEVDIVNGVPKAVVVKKAQILHKQNNFSKIKGTLLDKFWWETFNNRNYIKNEGNWKKRYTELERTNEKIYDDKIKMMNKLFVYEAEMEKAGIDHKKIYEEYLEIEKLKKHDYAAYREKMKQNNYL